METRLKFFMVFDMSDSQMQNLIRSERIFLAVALFILLFKALPRSVKSSGLRVGAELLVYHCYVRNALSS